MFFQFIAITTRLDWGFENPNKTAALIATLLVSVWFIPEWINRRHPKIKEFFWWLALLATAVLGGYLLRTGSRGGVLAASAGIGAILTFSFSWKKVWPKRKIAAAALLLIALGIAVFLLPQTARFSPDHSLNDASIGNRWLIWQNVPAMFVAAPGGWGLGNSGAAFMQWYQAPERTELYRTLVNSHATWLVELGWLGGAGYLLVWACAFTLAWPSRRRPASPPAQDPEPSLRLPAAPFAILLTFAATAAFSSVAEAWPLWLPPAVALVILLCFRWKCKCWPSRRTFLLAAFFPTVLLLSVILIIAAKTENPLHIKDSGKTVQLGNGEPQLVIVVGSDSKESPRALRAAWNNTGKRFSILWTTRSDAQTFPAKNFSLALFGKWEQETLFPVFENAQEIIIFSPQCLPDVFPEKFLSKTKVFFGEFSAESFTAQAWKGKCSCVIVPGMSEFINNWPELLLNRNQP